MSDRQQDFDQTHAIFAAMGSFWWRMLVFFGLCFLGHYVGTNCASAGEFFRDVMARGPSALFQNSDLNPAWVPISWMGTLLVGCRDGFGLIQLVALAVGLLFVWLSEDRYIHGFAIAALSQPIDTFLVEGTGSTSDFIIGLVVLGVWEAFVGLAYWWCWRQME